MASAMLTVSQISAPSDHAPCGLPMWTNNRYQHLFFQTTPKLLHVNFHTLYIIKVHF